MRRFLLLAFLVLLSAFSVGIPAQAFDPFRDDPFFRDQTSKRPDKQTILEVIKETIKKAEESASRPAGSVKAGDLPEPLRLSPAEEAALRGRLAVFPAEADHYWGGLVDVLGECERKLKETGTCGYSLPTWDSMHTRIMVREGRLMVPVRYLCYALGAGKEDVVWNPIRKAAEATVRGRKLVFPVESRKMLVDGQPVDLGVPITLYQDPIYSGFPATYAPLRPVAEALGYRVAWDAAARAALVYPEGTEPPELDQKLREEIERHRPLNLAPEGFRRMVEAAPEGVPRRDIGRWWYLDLPGGQIWWNPYISGRLADKDDVSLIQVEARLYPGATDEAAQRICDVLARAVPESAMPRIQELMADAARRMAAGGYVEGDFHPERAGERWLLWDYYYYQSKPYWFRLCVMRPEFEQYCPEPEKIFGKLPAGQ